MTIDVVVGDDLTGTADTLVQFLVCSERALVFPSLSRFEEAIANADLPAGDLAIGVSTESRHLGHTKAANRVGRAHRAALRLLPRLLFQRVDSAMRGNPGAELAAYRRATDAGRLLMTPAFLPSGRIVRDGTLYVNGVPLAESEVGRDLRTPMASSSVVELLALQSEELVISWQTRRSAHHEGVRDGALPTATGIIVADAETQADLDRLARFVIEYDLLHAVAGSAGLAGSIAVQLGSHGRAATLPRPGARRLLVVFGSPHPMAVRQLEYAHQALSLPIRRIDAACVGREPSEVLVDRLTADLQTHGIALLASPVLDITKATVEPAAMASALADLTSHLVEQRRVDGLVLAGGDIAAAVCDRLKVERIELTGQLFPGAPLGRVHGGSADGIWLVTKSGAHGDEQALATTLEALQRQPQPEDSAIIPTHGGE